jgi:hypothetical protein
MSARNLIFAAALSGLATPALAGTIDHQNTYDPYTHNGSDVVVVYQGDAVFIRYSNPRDGLRKIGVKPGMTLFSGKKKGNLVEGTALIFRKNCPPAPYYVIGSFDDGADLSLEGAVPRWDSRTCEITGYTDRAANARLVFRQAFGDY